MYIIRKLGDKRTRLASQNQVRQTMIDCGVGGFQSDKYLQNFSDGIIYAIPSLEKCKYFVTRSNLSHLRRNYIKLAQSIESVQRIAQLRK